MENGVETKQMQLGKWRLQKSAHLNGLAVLDVDHLTENPVEVFHRWEETQLRELGVLLVFITSSNAGLKFVFIARKEWGNLIENACELARQLGLQADESGKDASRMSFAPSEPAGDILFFDAERMFSTRQCPCRRSSTAGRVRSCLNLAPATKPHSSWPTICATSATPTPS